MNYLMTLTVFLLALTAGIFAFLELMPEAHFAALQRQRWGRELSLTIIFGIALGISLLTFNVIR
jgi:hypothetical protein